MTDVVAFDVNETLLDLAALDGPFEDLLGDAALRPLWFAQMLQLSFVGGLTGQYVDFGTAQRAALQMIADKAGVAVGEAEVAAIVDQMRSLPPHPDVRDGLERLRGTGLTVIALTNSTLDVAQDQVANAGLADLFDEVLSADEVRHLKPAPQAYQLVADRFETDLGEVRLVAAHAWDVAGALAAGAKAAFVGRGGVVPSPLGRRPDIVGSDLTAVVDQILLVDAS